MKRTLSNTLNLDKYQQCRQYISKLLILLSIVPYGRLYRLSKVTILSLKGHISQFYFVYPVHFQQQLLPRIIQFYCTFESVCKAIGDYSLIMVPAKLLNSTAGGHQFVMRHCENNTEVIWILETL